MSAPGPDGFRSGFAALVGRPNVGKIGRASCRERVS